MVSNFQVAGDFRRAFPNIEWGVRGGRDLAASSCQGCSTAIGTLMVGLRHALRGRRPLTLHGDARHVNRAIEGMNEGAGEEAWY